MDTELPLVRSARMPLSLPGSKMVVTHCNLVALCTSRPVAIVATVHSSGQEKYADPGCFEHLLTYIDKLADRMAGSYQYRLRSFLPQEDEAISIEWAKQPVDEPNDDESPTTGRLTDRILFMTVDAVGGPRHKVFRGAADVGDRVVVRLHPAAASTFIGEVTAVGYITDGEPGQQLRFIEGILR